MGHRSSVHSPPRRRLRYCRLLAVTSADAVLERTGFRFLLVFHTAARSSVPVAPHLSRRPVLSVPEILGLLKRDMSEHCLQLFF